MESKGGVKDGEAEGPPARVSERSRDVGLGHGLESLSPEMFVFGMAYEGQVGMQDQGQVTFFQIILPPSSGDDRSGAPPQA